VVDRNMGYIGKHWA